jgi:hypothetical protein
MKLVKARREGLNIEVLMDGKAYMARPENWDKPGFLEAVKRAFTMKYDIFDGEGVKKSHVDYDFLHGFIMVKRDEGDKQIKIPIFDLNAQRYYIKEKITGFLIWPLIDGGKITIVAEGEKSIAEYALTVSCDDENLEKMILEFTVGYMIRWMSFNIGF